MCVIFHRQKMISRKSASPAKSHGKLSRECASCGGCGTGRCISIGGCGRGCSGSGLFSRTASFGGSGCSETYAGCIGSSTGSGGSGCTGGVAYAGRCGVEVAV
ncbi:Hypothetical predicted protein [Octopus vulgaris]|uniref:Uncharacterized protein n=1 Tax=Octopus vulgaris TaxID=6645 RepID=A0AA36EYS8_OCTVU|nr:Hypothetical predicted protein [Octopus vulgaris]